MTDQDKHQKITDLMLQSVPGLEEIEAVLNAKGEAALSKFIRWATEQGLLGALMPGLGISTADTVVLELPMGYGRADLVIFHMDGTATVAEIKDGSQGVRSVVGGIGQVGLYATQLDRSKTLLSVRRALVWTPVAEKTTCQLIERSCLAAGVTSIFLPPVEKLVRESLRCHLVNCLDSLRGMV